MYAWVAQRETFQLVLLFNSSRPFLPSSTFVIMFKSILPSKRIPDSEFTMLTTGTESAVNLIGKENNPALTVTTNVPTRSRPEKEKTKKNKGKAQNLPVEDVEYEFTRLMVRFSLLFLPSLVQTCRDRMTFRSLRPSGPSWLPWSHL